MLSNLLRRFSCLYTAETRRVLFAWELGGGYGHVQRMAPIARALAEREHRVGFALRDIGGTSDLLRTLPNTDVLQAPVFNGKASNKPAYSYADVLHRCGYASAETLGELVAEWRGLIDSQAASLIVCDHSPTVILAAAGRVPVIHIGSGFATPPPGRPFLPLHSASAEGARERETQVLQAIRAVQASIGAPIIDHVCDLFGTAETFACCLPELDPYRSTRPAPADGPVHELPSPQPPPKEPFVFGYLTGLDVRVPRVIESLVKARVPAGLFVRQLDPICEDIVQGSTVKLYYTPQNLCEALASASAVLHHGGLSTSETALAMGRPQFLLPRNLEQALTANAVERMGCGINLARQISNAGEVIRRSLQRATYGRQAAVIAARIAERPRNVVTAAIVNACLKHLGQSVVERNS